MSIKMFSYIQKKKDLFVNHEINEPEFTELNLNTNICDYEDRPKSIKNYYTSGNYTNTLI